MNIDKLTQEKTKPSQKFNPFFVNEAKDKIKTEKHKMKQKIVKFDIQNKLIQSKNLSENEKIRL